MERRYCWSKTRENSRWRRWWSRYGSAATREITFAERGERFLGTMTGQIAPEMNTGINDGGSLIFPSCRSFVFPGYRRGLPVRAREERKRVKKRGVPTDSIHRRIKANTHGGEPSEPVADADNNENSYTISFFHRRQLLFTLLLIARREKSNRNAGRFYTVCRKWLWKEKNRRANRSKVSWTVSIFVEYVIQCDRLSRFIFCYNFIFIVFILYFIVIL